MQRQYSLLGYRTDLHFHDYKLAIQIDKNEQSDRNIDYEIKNKNQYNKNLVVNVLELILPKRNFMFF